MEGVEGELAIDIREPLLSSARGKLSVLSKESMASDKCTIFRTPGLIRQRNKHLYEPQTVAIGPYGRRDDKPSLRAMEWLKWRYLQEFLSRNNSTLEDCIAEIQKLVPEARGCYFEWVNLKPVEFAEMLLLDGCFILEFLIKWKLGAGRDKKIFPRTIPSATELLDAGVTIKKKKKKKKKKKNENETHEKRLSAFLDVAFEDGVLEIPFLSVDPSTLPRFSNLLAFEQCLRCEPDEAYMTSYAIFMNCLIDKREDVAVLHQRGILENNLASDEELAVFFNQLSDYAYFDYEKHYLAEVFRDVRKYCDSRWPKWRAKLVRDYFSNPWAIISLIAAAVLLILTILQTVYTICSYYHPGN
ncbi:UPF0481 protein [Ananas comosus]|uniref:UPF0481 protein n=1 Tax=Ananas comosus TaxID=4615 RepID=A0A199V0C3_ANACO|nr:UPF0481 protein [Ananas comosus]